MLARHSGATADAALAAYARAARIRPPEPAELAPFLRARELEAAAWTLGMAHQYPQRYRETARSLLAGVLESRAESPSRPAAT